MSSAAASACCGGSATSISIRPGRAIGSSATRMSFSRTPGMPLSAPISAPVVALPAASSRRRRRARSAASSSAAVANAVAWGLVTLSMPSSGRCNTPIAAAGTMPPRPATKARIGASVEISPRRSVRASVVSNRVGGASEVETRVPAGIETSAGDGVRRVNTTLPLAALAVSRVTPSNSASWSRSRPLAVSMKAAWYTASSWLDSTAYSRAKVSAISRVTLPGLRSVRRGAASNRPWCS